MKKIFALLFLSSFVLISHAQETKKTLLLHLERIDPKTGKIETVVEKVPADKVGIIVTDMWDKHWCKSWTEREALMVPKMNKVLAAARKMGVQIIFSPSSVADFYKDYPQRKAVLNMPKSGDYEYPSVYQLRDSAEQANWDYTRYSQKYFAETIYEARDVADATYKGFPTLPPFAFTGGCECKDRQCQQANVWTRQNKDLVIEANDLITDGDSNTETFNICKAKGITHLLYMGAAGNMCLTWTRGNSVINMANRGFKCAYMEDLMISISGNGYNPDTKESDPAFTPAEGDSLVLNHLKKYIAPSIKADEVFVVKK
jgi:nicotinamidase-related amidase